MPDAFKSFKINLEHPKSQLKLNCQNTPKCTFKFDWLGSGESGECHLIRTWPVDVARHRYADLQQGREQPGEVSLLAFADSQYLKSKQAAWTFLQEIHAIVRCP